MVFSNDDQLSALIAQILVILSVYVIADGLSNVLGGVVKGVGKQLVAFPFVFFSYYAVGLPLTAFFGFYLKWGVKGLCLGTLIGTVSHAACFFFLVWRLDWPVEAQRAAARVGVSKPIEDMEEPLLVSGANKHQDEEEGRSVHLNGDAADASSPPPAASE